MFGRVAGKVRGSVGGFKGTRAGEKRGEAERGGARFRDAVRGASCADMLGRLVVISNVAD